MDKYEELKMLQKYVKKYRESLKESLKTAQEQLDEAIDSIINDTSEDVEKIEMLGLRFSRKQRISEELEECNKLWNELSGAESAYTVPSINGTEELTTQREIDLKQALYRLKREYKSVLRETFLDLSYEYGNYGLLQTEGEQEDFESELKTKSERGSITQEDYEALTYGISFCLEEPEQENVDIKPIEEDVKVSYNPQADIGDNSYEELQTMKNIVEQYILRSTQELKRRKEALSKRNLTESDVKLLKMEVSDKQMATGILQKLENLEILLSSATTLGPEQAQKYFEKHFKEFKETSFNELTTIMSDTYSSLRDVRREYDNVHMTADPRIQSTEEIEAELKELLEGGEISPSDYERFVYTMGYFKVDCIRSGEKVKSTQDLGREVLDILKNDTLYVDQTENEIGMGVNELDKQTTEDTRND